MTAGGRALLHRDLIITLAARHKLPTVYFDRSFVAAGGLLSYGPDSPLLSSIQYPRFSSAHALPYLLMLSSKPSAAN
ncbi:MAG: hypothetical protein WB563_13695 [Pseudolabrys sp.]